MKKNRITSPIHIITRTYKFSNYRYEYSMNKHTDFSKRNLKIFFKNFIKFRMFKKIKIGKKIN